MEVDSTNFWSEFLPILKHISRASFISIDFEMSGITLEPKNAIRGRDKPTLQQVYDETKRAAETFQILQVGITCIEEDRDENLYIARPFNFQLSPLFLHGDRLAVDRKISLSSHTLHFLKSNGFDITLPFTCGVPYLSRAEGVAARKNHVERMNRSKSIADLKLSPNDPEALKFYNDSNKRIKDWLENNDAPKMDFVTIYNKDSPLNGFQRRLIHQLVRSEYPDLRSFARSNGDIMQVEKIDHEREATVASGQIAQLDAMIAKQTGLRFLFEAMAGGELENIDARWFCRDIAENMLLIELDSMENDIANLQKTLRQRKSVIIGHNLFTDLLFMYSTFFGPLPDTVEKFQSLIHGLFPTVVDTKYLATHDSNSVRTSSRLQEVWNSVRYHERPAIELDIDHGSYLGTPKMHEAGYDSWITARAFVKLAGQLSKNLKKTNQSSIPRVESGNIVVNQASQLKNSSNNHESENENGGTSSDLMDLENAFVSSIRSAARRVAKPLQQTKKAKQPRNEKTHTRQEDASHDLDPEKKPFKTEESEGQWIENIGGEFWNKFANKLRVFGTQEEICVLDGKD